MAYIHQRRVALKNHEADCKRPRASIWADCPTKFVYLFGVVLDKVNRLNSSMRKSRLSKYKQDKLLELFVAGATVRTASSLVGVNKTTASYYEDVRYVHCDSLSSLRHMIMAQANWTIAK